MKKILMGLGIILIIFGFYFYWKGQKKIEIVDDGVGIMPTRTEEREKNILFKFAVMADIHNDTVSLDKALAQAQGEGDKFVVVAGDVTINGTEPEETRIKESLNGGGIQYFIVPGNHDGYKKIWIFGKKYQSVRKNNFKLILVDNSDWRGLGKEQKAWIENEVKECLIIKCVAAMHIPLENTFSKHIMGEYEPAVAIEAKWMKDVFLKNNVKTGYSGHIHYSSSYTIDDWQTVLVGAISKDRNTETPRYTEVTVYDDGSLENTVKILNNQ